MVVIRIRKISCIKVAMFLNIFTAQGRQTTDIYFKVFYAQFLLKALSAIIENSRRNIFACTKLDTVSIVAFLNVSLGASLSSIGYS